MKCKCNTFFFFFFFLGIEDVSTDFNPEVHGNHLEIMLEKFAVRCGVAGLNGRIVGWPEVQTCMWLLQTVSPLEMEAAFGKVWKLLILFLEDHILFSVVASAISGSVVLNSKVSRVPGVLLPKSKCMYYPNAS